MRTEFTLVTLLISMFMFTNFYGQGALENIKHVKVYYEPGMFGGWPANHGVWNWGDEILVGFSKGHYKDLGPERHNFDKENPELHVLARSLDGGETWKLEDPGVGDGDLVVPDNGSYHGLIRKDVKAPEPIPAEQIDFTHPNLAFTVRMTDHHGAESRIWYSYDRGKDWKGPFGLPNFGTPGIGARTDYIIDSRNECMLFLNAAKANGKEGRVMGVKTIDGGENWNFVSWIGPEPDGFSIMPASVRISDTEILVTTRRREESGRFIDAYLSQDNGATWQPLANPVENCGQGNPPAMVKMKDGRICLIYGYRALEEDIKNNRDKSEIRAKISKDNGKTWSKDYVLRDDGSGKDLGYPRVVQRPDGKIVSLYYFMDKETGPERYIAATIWDPPSIEE
ncbi:sialidase family protein [Arenibacter sp. F20364]|uniref:sialidase family protein n=1 Tax=Arenibacter sp. F20364 TaxID=2926415 RepID=UPI001FF2FF1E|nr:sialidase family protein [Arenibacter sp. F20364]MCK0190927.1 glycoside hydrolase [Arenibacter sp. F20364]